MAAEKTTEAETFLRDALKDGLQEDSVVLTRQALTGYGIKPRTLQRASARLGIMRKFDGFGKGRKVYWSLPSPIDDSIDARLPEFGVDGPDTMKSALFDTGSIIDDNKIRVGIDGGIDGSPVNCEPVFDVEL